MIIWAPVSHLHHSFVEVGEGLRSYLNVHFLLYDFHSSAERIVHPIFQSAHEIFLKALELLSSWLSRGKSFVSLQEFEATLYIFPVDALGGAQLDASSAGSFNDRNPSFGVAGQTTWTSASWQQSSSFMRAIAANVEVLNQTFLFDKVEVRPPLLSLVFVLETV